MSSNDSGLVKAMLRQLDERERMTPVDGYNVLLLNEYDPTKQDDDRLELLQHVATWEEAQSAKSDFEGMMPEVDPTNILIYPSQNRAAKEFNQNHDPDNGQFTSGDGGSGGSDSDISSGSKDTGTSKYRSAALAKGEKPLNYDAALKKHDDFFATTKLTGYSFDPATGKGYNLTDKDAAKEFYARHGDGEHDLYLVATTNHVGPNSRENHAEYEQISSNGQYPLMGYWKSPDTGKEYNDVSFPVDNGISKDEVDKMLVNYKQESTIKIDKNGDFEFIDSSVQDKPKATSPRPLKGEKKRKKSVN